MARCSARRRSGSRSGSPSTTPSCSASRGAGDRRRSPPPALRDVEMPVRAQTILAGRPVEQHHALIAAVTEVIERALSTPPGRTRVGITTEGPDTGGSAAGRRPWCVPVRSPPEPRRRVVRVTVRRMPRPSARHRRRDPRDDAADPRRLRGGAGTTSVPAVRSTPTRIRSGSSASRELTVMTTGRVARDAGYDSWRSLFRAVADVLARRAVRPRRRRPHGGRPGRRPSCRCPVERRLHDQGAGVVRGPGPSSPSSMPSSTRPTSVSASLTPTPTWPAAGAGAAARRDRVPRRYARAWRAPWPSAWLACTSTRSTGSRLRAGSP